MVRKAHSYGIIPIVKEGDAFFVALVKNISGDHWGFPKGTPEKNESPKETALRELHEETGILNPTLISEAAFEETYIFEGTNEQIDKTNTYFLAKLPLKIALAPLLPDVLECGWFSFAEAKEKITFDNGRRILAQVESFLKA